MYLLFVTLLMSLSIILEEIGLSGAGYQRVTGGDINSCWKIEYGKKKYFLKTNQSGNYPQMFKREAAGLTLLKEKSRFIIPPVLKEGIAGSEQYLLLEWLEQRPGNHSEQYDAGKKLADLHLHQSDKFGLEEDNYIGSLRQVNTWHPDWSSFYSNCRIMPLVQLLYDRKLFSKTVVDQAGQFCKHLSEYFPAEPASFLHGDLWSGNYMHTTHGPALIDPAVYYGHREMDIGMTKLFGGFGEEFYRGYNEVYPLEKDWNTRLEYSQLYPLLVHSVLFGGGYVGRCERILTVNT